MSSVPQALTVFTEKKIGEGGGKKVEKILKVYA